MDGFPRSAINQFERAVAALARRESQERAAAAPETAAASPDRCDRASGADRVIVGSGAGIASGRLPEGQD